MPEDNADEAINRVLAREREARKAVERCRHEGEATLNAARAKARRILERADHRITGLRAKAKRSIARAVSDSEAEWQPYSESAELDDARLALLDRAVRALAAELTEDSG